MTEPLLEVKNLRINFKTYAGLVQAVRGVDFTLAKGETLAIVGESGSGKSVTSNTLMHLIPQPAGRYEDGQILFEGKDLLKLSELDARELIKVTLLQNTDENIHEVAKILEEEIGVDTVQKIGRILIPL